MEKYASKVIAVLKAEVGYLEKKSNSQLDSKTANAGYNNYTKYARDLDALGYFYNGPKNGYPYCDVTVDWAFVQAYGVETALELLCQPKKSYGAGCEYSARYYKQKGQFHTKNPKPGDQIFFWNSKKTEAAHTGLVVKVDSTYVYTIEGNTSGASGVIANGGGVFEKKYALNHNRIYGYGRPKYDPEPVAEPVPEVEKDNNVPINEYTLTQFIKDIQAATGAAVDGIAGPETLSKTVTLSRYINRKHKAVKAVQKRLYALGYTVVGEADGVAGALFQKAVKEFQRKNGCTADGVITKKNKTWKKLLGML